MNYLEAMILSIVQGIVEWLPVSSEGLSVLLMLNLFGQDVSYSITYAFFLHLGTALAVLIRFRKEFIQMFYGSQMLRVVVVSTISTGLVAIPLLTLIELQSARIMNFLIGILLIMTGIVLRLPQSSYREIENLSISDMIFLGFAQGIAVLPGVSRSGMTVSFLLLRKLNERAALTLSFIISVPAVLGAIFIRGMPSEMDFSIGLSILVVTCIFGYLTMEALLKFARKVDFSKFCITFGIIAIVLTALTF
ncbi:MAG: undecaprenyl-diphosphate phosphatase [Archaeoglobaceae archaeon]